MKIVFYANSCIPFEDGTIYKRPLGGVETATSHLAESLAKLKHDVVVYTTHDDPKSSESV